MPTITRIGDSGTLGIEADMIDIVETSSGHIVTPIRNAANGILELLSFVVSKSGSEIILLGRSGEQGDRFELTLSAVGISGNRVVTAVRSRPDGRCMLISWRVSEDGKEIERLHDSGELAGSIENVSLVRWTANATATTVNVITVVRTSAGRGKVILWSVDPDGRFSRRGDSGTQMGAVDRIDAHVVEPFSSSDERWLATAVRQTGTRRLLLIRWKIRGGGPAKGAKIERWGPADDSGSEVDLLAVMEGGADQALITVARLRKSRRLSFRARFHIGGWLESTGTIAETIDRLAIDASHSPTGCYFTAVRLHESRRLRVHAWIGPSYNNGPKMHADSADQAGQVRLVSVLYLPPSPPSDWPPHLRCVTAVTTHVERVKLILWDYDAES